jgi:hypothetical protein
MNVSTGRIQKTIAQLISEAVEAERLRCAAVAQRYPTDSFSYTGDMGELLRLRDTIAEALAKGLAPSEAIS